MSGPVVVGSKPPLESSAKKGTTPSSRVPSAPSSNSRTTGGGQRVKVRLSSQMDDATEGDVELDGHYAPSPRFNDTTTNDSLGYEYTKGRGDGLSMSSIDPELNEGGVVVGSLTTGTTTTLGVGSGGSRRGGLSRSRSGRGSRPFSHPHHSHYGGKSMGAGDHSITQFAEMDDANVSALQQMTRGGGCGGLTLASQWKSQFDDNDETDNEWKGVEQLQSPEHNAKHITQVTPPS